MDKAPESTAQWTPINCFWCERDAVFRRIQLYFFFVRKHYCWRFRTIKEKRDDESMAFRPSIEWFTSDQQHFDRCVRFVVWALCERQSIQFTFFTYCMQSVSLSILFLFINMFIVRICDRPPTHTLAKKMTNQCFLHAYDVCHWKRGQIDWRGPKSMTMMIGCYVFFLCFSPFICKLFFSFFAQLSKLTIVLFL